MLKSLTMAVALAALSGPLTAQSASAPAKARDWNPDAIVWDRIGPDGTRFALLEGVRDVPGAPFSYAFYIPGGVWDGPHSHNATVRVFVARGALRLGYGTTADRTAARIYPAGSYLIVPAGAVHFDGADANTLIIGTATGPWSTDYIGGARGSAGTPPR